MVVHFYNYYQLSFTRGRGGDSVPKVPEDPSRIPKTHIKVCRRALGILALSRRKQAIPGAPWPV